MDSYSNKQALYDALLERVNRPGQFTGENNIVVTKVCEDYAEGVLTIEPKSFNYRGIVHGGCLAALADTVAGVACCTRGHGTVTVNYMLNFLRPATGKTIKCVAKAEKTGKTISVFHCDLTDDQGRAVASGSFTFFVMPALITEEMEQFG